MRLRAKKLRGGAIRPAAHMKFRSSALPRTQTRQTHGKTAFPANYNTTTLPSQLRCATLPYTGRARTPTTPLAPSMRKLSSVCETEGVTPTAPAGHLPQRGRQVIITRASQIVFCAYLLKIRCKRRHCVMPACYKYSRKEATPPPAPCICAYLRLRGKREPPRAILLPYSGGERKHAVSRRRARGLSLKITTFFRVSSRKKV